MQEPHRGDSASQCLYNMMSMPAWQRGDLAVALPHLVATTAACFEPLCVFGLPQGSRCDATVVVSMGFECKDPALARCAPLWPHRPFLLCTEAALKTHSHWCRHTTSKRHISRRRE